MTEPSKNPILNERVKPAMLNPLVKYITPSADIKWILLCFGIALAIFALAYTTFYRIPTQQKRRSTGPGAKKSLDPQRPEKK